MSCRLLSFLKAKTCLWFVSVEFNINVPVLWVGSETVSCGLLLWMARICMDSNSQKLGQLFQVLVLCVKKGSKIVMASYSWWKLLDIFFIASVARFVFGLSQQVMTYARDKAPSIFNPFIYPAFRNSLWQEHKWFCILIIAKEKKAISKLREPYLMPGSCFFFRCTNRGSNQRFDQRICGICGNDCWKLWLVNWSGEAEVSFLSHWVYPKSLKSRQYLKIVFLLAT